MRARRGWRPYGYHDETEASGALRPILTPMRRGPAVHDFLRLPGSNGAPCAGMNGAPCAGMNGAPCAGMDGAPAPTMTRRALGRADKRVGDVQNDGCALFSLHVQPEPAPESFPA